MTSAEINAGMNSPVDSVPYLKAYLFLSQRDTRALHAYTRLLCKEVEKQMKANRRKNFILRGLRKGKVEDRKRRKVVAESIAALLFENRELRNELAKYSGW